MGASALFAGLLAVLPGCAKGPAGAARASAQVELRVAGQQTDLSGKARPTEEFARALEEALAARGIRRAPAGEACDAVVVGQGALVDEARPESSAGGPMIYFFTEGAYALRLESPDGGVRARWSGPLDLRGATPEELRLAMHSFGDSARVVFRRGAARAANDVADALARRP